MLCDCGNGKETMWNDMCEDCHNAYDDLLYCPDGVCEGCMRQAMHKMCPAHGTPFYMTGVPFTEEVERLYNKKKSEENFDEQKFFLAIREKDGIMEENKEELRDLLKQLIAAKNSLSNDAKDDYEDVAKCDAQLSLIINQLIDLI